MYVHVSEIDVESRDVTTFHFHFIDKSRHTRDAAKKK